MPKASVLQFRDYTVEGLRFTKNDIEINQREFHLNPHFQQEVIEKGGNQYDVKLSVEICSSEDNLAPFELCVEMIGHFSYTDTTEESGSDEFKKAILERNTVSILFPFLRQIVATLTSTANIAPLILPIMNFNNNDTGD